MLDIKRREFIALVGGGDQLDESSLATHGRTSAARLAAIPAGESPVNRGVQSLL